MMIKRGGKAVLVETLALLLVWLVVMPRYLLGQSESQPVR
jgi:hypothetical protein